MYHTYTNAHIRPSYFLYHIFVLFFTLFLYFCRFKSTRRWFYFGFFFCHHIIKAIGKVRKSEGVHERMRSKEHVAKGKCRGKVKKAMQISILTRLGNEIASKYMNSSASAKHIILTLRFCFGGFIRLQFAFFSLAAIVSGSVFCHRL